MTVMMYAIASRVIGVCLSAKVDGAAEVEEAEAHRAQLVSIMENIPPTLA